MTDHNHNKSFSRTRRNWQSKLQEVWRGKYHETIIQCGRLERSQIASPYLLALHCSTAWRRRAILLNASQFSASYVSTLAVNMHFSFPYLDKICFATILFTAHHFRRPPTSGALSFWLRLEDGLPEWAPHDSSPQDSFFSYTLKIAYHNKQGLLFPSTLFPFCGRNFHRPHPGPFSFFSQPFILSSNVRVNLKKVNLGCTIYGMVVKYYLKLFCLTPFKKSPLQMLTGLFNKASTPPGGTPTSAPRDCRFAEKPTLRKLQHRQPKSCENFWSYFSLTWTPESKKYFSTSHIHLFQE